MSKSSSSMPSLAALLGLLAIAGYQNRDKIKEIFGGADTGAQPGAAPAPLPAPSTGGILSDIVDKFRNIGAGAAADSWVAKGPNQDVTPRQTEGALGGDLIDALVKQTGLSREELLARLSKILPEAVDKMTPDGSLPKA
jgi:uncharacterized protein YidB (DUF937 family)